MSRAVWTTGDRRGDGRDSGGGKELHSLLTQIQKITDTKVQKIHPPTLHPPPLLPHLSSELENEYTGGGAALTSNKEQIN